MSPDDVHKKKGHSQPGKGFWQALDGILERLGENLDDLAEGFRRGLQPNQQQPIPIPVPSPRVRRR